MTNEEAIEVIKSGKFLMIDDSEVCFKALDKAVNALFKLEMLKSYGCVVCKMSKEYDCNGCAYEDVEDWKDPCRICRRNQKDYYREAAKNED